MKRVMIIRMAMVMMMIMSKIAGYLEFYEEGDDN